MSPDQAGRLLPLAVVLPIVGAVLAPLLARLSPRLPLVASLLAMVSTTVGLAAIAPLVARGQVIVVHVGGWRPSGGTQLGVSFAADPLGVDFALLCAGLGAILVGFSLSELSELGAKELGGYACLMQLLLAALIGSALTADLLNLFVWFEVAALSSYGLTAFFLERPIALEAGFKIMVLTNLAAFFVFVAVILLYAGHGALNLGQLRAELEVHARTADAVALALLLAGFGTKAGLVPFHAWLPDAHTAAPGPVSALFSGLMVNLGVLGLLRILFDAYGPPAQPAHAILLVLGGVGAVGGAVLALTQDDLKRLLAFDTVSQISVLVMAAGVGSRPALVGLSYHLVNHALFKSLLFLCAGAIVHATGLTRLSEMGGLARHKPLVTAAFLAGVLAIAGVPPLNGYVSLGLIHDAVRHGHVAELAALTLAQALTVAALGRATYLAFFRRRDDDYDRSEPLRPGMIAGFGALATACLGFGVFPGWILAHVVEPAAASLTAGRAYAAAVIGTGGALTVPSVEFRYLETTHLLTTAGTLVAGGALAWWVVRHPGLVARRPPVSWLRRAHTGSVNDYAAYSCLGLAGCLIALLLAR